MKRRTSIVSGDRAGSRATKIPPWRMMDQSVGELLEAPAAKLGQAAQAEAGPAPMAGSRRAGIVMEIHNAYSSVR
jgi:hypothetical protein